MARNDQKRTSAKTAPRKAAGSKAPLTFAVEVPDAPRAMQKQPSGPEVLEDIVNRLRGLNASEQNAVIKELISGVVAARRAQCEDLQKQGKELNARLDFLSEKSDELRHLLASNF